MNTVFRYAGLTRFLKGNTHIHTTNSDGRWSVQDVLDRYQQAGYDFLAVTDHNVVTRLEDRSTGSLCLIDSVELDRGEGPYRCRHVVCIGVGPKFPDRTTFPRMLAAAKRDKALLVLAHPHWSGANVNQLIRGGYVGVEVHNGVCHYLNHRESGVWAWDDALQRGHDLFGFAADDNHGVPEGIKTFDLGWIMVAADTLDRPAILKAIRAGKFYSSTGPLFRSLDFADRKLTVHCSPARHIWLSGPTWVVTRVNCPDDKLVDSATFDVEELLAKNKNLPFLRLEIEDERGRRAWTNKLFV